MDKGRRNYSKTAEDVHDLVKESMQRVLVTEDKVKVRTRLSKVYPGFHGMSAGIQFIHLQRLSKWVKQISLVDR